MNIQKSHHRIAHLKSSLIQAIALISLILIGSCKKPTDCYEHVMSQYGNDPRVQVVNAYHINYRFIPEDTAYFSYSAKDTLIFQISDSSGVIDTVSWKTYLKQVYFEYNYAPGSDAECEPRTFDEIMVITFVSNDTTYGNLTFQLRADEYDTEFEYHFFGKRLEGTTLKYLRETEKNIPLVNIRGIEFYNVFKGSNPNIGVKEYYVNREKQLFMFTVDEKTFLRIN